jgi:hypothetical protein
MIKFNNIHYELYIIIILLAFAYFALTNFKIAHLLAIIIIIIIAIFIYYYLDNLSNNKDINVDYSLRADGVVYRNTSFNVTVPTGFPLRRRNNFSLVYVFDEADLSNGDVVDLYISNFNGTGTPEALFEATQIIVEYIKR